LEHDNELWKMLVLLPACNFQLTNFENRCELCNKQLFRTISLSNMSQDVTATIHSKNQPVSVVLLTTTVFSAVSDN